MSPIDVVAIVILIVAILVLVYYYLQNNPASVQKLRTYVPTTADPHMGEILQNDSDYDDLSREKDTVEESKEEESMSKRIKIKLSDIDMSGLNTDAFSNKIDAFLDEKSEELIQSWSLATTNDLKTLKTDLIKQLNLLMIWKKALKNLKNLLKLFKKRLRKN